MHHETFRRAALALAVAGAHAGTVAAQQGGESRNLDGVTVRDTRLAPAPARETVVADSIVRLRPATSDSASLLREVPGVALSGAGGVSSLPVIHGLADDRNRIRVDGMDLVSACANHMNPPLSYIDPTAVASVRVFAGVVPVSVGGDSIGGAVVVEAAPPRFAGAGEGLLATGEVGAFYRSNGDAHGVNAAATLAGETLGFSYAGATAESRNYRAARDFKAATFATYTARGDHRIEGDEVGSSAYRTENHRLGIAFKHDGHLLDFKFGWQHIPDQGFPNQHMDMTDNKSRQVNLGYTGGFGWGNLQARVYDEHTRHRMDFADDKLYWYGMAHNVAGMPMRTDGRNTGALVKADIGLNERDLLRLGAELQRYRLDDWWDPVAHSMMMSPNTFWNINDGKRDRSDVFAEWEARWTPRWLTLAGLRSSTVRMDAGDVQGYNTGAGYAVDAAAFNARDRKRTDHNVDLSLLARFTPDAGQAYEGGYSRKTRSPSLYERYTWSTNGMAMTMNNWLNEGNGYVGDIDLKPEVAHTLSFAAGWHDAARDSWEVKVTPWYSRVDNYIDAKCRTTCTANRFNYLQLVNQDARLYGVDLSGAFPIASTAGWGSFTGRGTVAYVNGRNRETGDELYNIMPLNARLAVEHRLGGWTGAVETILVAAKDKGSDVRNEIRTGGYGLLNLRGSYDSKHYRIDVGLENALDKQYAHPLGGAYIGQGRTMSLNGAGAPWGIAVPGMGRSAYVGATLRF